MMNNSYALINNNFDGSKYNIPILCSDKDKIVEPRSLYLNFLPYILDLGKDEIEQQSVKRYQSNLKNLENQIKDIEKYYELKNPKEIKEFLSSNTDLIPIIIEAKNKIHEIFGQKVKLFLEFYIDHEIPEWRTLFIIIKSLKSRKEILELKERFLNEWFIHITDNAIDHLAVSVNRYGI